MFSGLVVEGFPVENVKYVGGVMPCLFMNVEDFYFVILDVKHVESVEGVRIENSKHIRGAMPRLF